MAIIQPLYYAGGKYSPSVDRKLLAALLAADNDDGTPLTGVFYNGTAGAFTYTVTANQVSVSPGLCVIADTASGAAGDGIYVAGIVSTNETAAFTSASGVRTDTVYAVVDPTLYTITNRVLTANVATLTTSSNHGFATGQTVVVTGIDDIFDGSYVITAVTSDTFSYARTTNVGGVTTAASGTGSTATITTTSAHGLYVGESVTVAGVTPVGYNGTYVITGVTTNTVSYASATTGAQTIAGTISRSVASTTVTPHAQKGVTQKTISNKALETRVATLTSTAHGFSANDVITVRGVGYPYDGTFILSAITTDTFSYSININPNATDADTDFDGAVSATTSSVAKASVPFKIVVDVGNAGTFSSKNKIAIAQLNFTGSGSTPNTVTDLRRYTSASGGVFYEANSQVSATFPGRIKYSTSVANFSFYNGTSWVSFITLGTSGTTAAAANHNHDSSYTLAGHTHSQYTAATHTHTAAQVGIIAETIPDPGSDGLASNANNNFLMSSLGDTWTSLTFDGSTYFDDSFTLATGKYVYVYIAYSAGVNFGTPPFEAGSQTVFVAPRINLTNISGTLVVSPTPVDSGATNGRAAEDGTAYAEANTASSNNRTSISGEILAMNGSRLVKITNTSGSTRTYYVHLQARLSFGGGSVDTRFYNPVLRVIPFFVGTAT